MGILQDMKDSSIGLEALLNLNGQIFIMNKLYWVKMEAYKVTSTKHIPHGIRYSLTLHDSNNTRVLGYDNAHSIKLKRKRFSGTKTTWDHIHKKDRIENYEFETAAQLLEDFWADVDKHVKQEKR